MDLRTFCSESTAHGLRKIVAAKSRARRIFWLIVFTVAVVSLMIHLYLRLNLYLKYRHHEITYMLYESSVEYPDVTVCNINPVTSSSQGANQQLRKRYLEDPFLSGGACEDPSYEGVTDVWSASVPYTKALLAAAGAGNITNSTQQKSDVIIHCSFAGLECSPENFETFLDINYHQCHTVSLSALIKQLAQESKKPEPGGGFGLSLVLYLDTVLTYDNYTTTSTLSTHSTGSGHSIDTARAPVVIHQKV